MGEESWCLVRCSTRENATLPHDDLDGPSGSRLHLVVSKEGKTPLTAISKSTAPCLLAGAFSRFDLDQFVRRLVIQRRGSIGALALEGRFRVASGERGAMGFQRWTHELNSPSLGIEVKILLRADPLGTGMGKHGALPCWILLCWENLDRVCFLP